MAAFQKAVAAGVDMVELDVRMTKDFHLVVHHDRSVRRTTGGKGNIWNMTLQEVRTLDAGSWFNPKFYRERIPTLREVLEFLLPTNVGINIEVKTDGDPRKGAHLEECVILVIMEKRFDERTLVSSFDHKFLKNVHSLFPAIKTGALYHPVRDVRKKPSALCTNIGASAFVCSRTQINKKMVLDAKSKKLVVACYGVNTPQHFAEVLDLGVDAVVTDWPEKLRRAIHNKAR